jgi:hypothetical protein
MSLTKKKLLEKAAIDKPQKLAKKFFGEDVFVKLPSELKRCRRAAQMFDAKGNAKDSYRERHRVYTIIDCVCDKDGKLVFSDADLEAVSSLDSMKLDALHAAIQEWVDSKEKNEEAGSQS